MIYNKKDKEKMQLPNKTCNLCPRLIDFRQKNQEKFPNYFNGAVPSFGNIDAKILIVGLAPGLNGANQTGRPFTNDYAGDILYPVLKEKGFATGNYQKRSDDGFTLINCRISNAVRCVPPQNKPLPCEFNNCLPFLVYEISLMKNLSYIVSLGGDSHRAIIKAFNLKQADFKFAHGAKHKISDTLTLIDSYHTSRYNVNTNRMTRKMFEDIIDMII